MIQKIKKTNLILGLLVLAFCIVSISIILEIQTPSFFTPEQPIIIEIPEHLDTKISHGGDQWPLGCIECHTEPVYGECVDCHSPDIYVGDDDATYFPHHDNSYGGFKDCWSSEPCHDPDPEDVRYVKVDLVDGNDWEAWHEFCNNCHADTTHEPPDT